MSEQEHSQPIIDPSMIIPIDKTEASGGKDLFNVVFIGAGNVMFGSLEGPWNHSFRFEHKLGPRLRIVAIIDPATDRANAVLKAKRESFVVSAYQNTRVFATLQDFVDNASVHDKPRAVVIGSPPMFRGGIRAGKDIELQVLEHFPGVPLFVEKPVATGPVVELQDSFVVATAIKASGTVCGVGYMLRYLKAVQRIKQIIHANNLTVMATIGRYACAYESIAKPDWWSKEKSGGPIIEQATHLCDLSRYFGGEVKKSTVAALTLEWDEPPAHLSKIPIDESKIAEDDRIPRVTSATWKYTSGAVGSIMHIAALQGTNYTCEFEVYTDGFMFKLEDIYVEPILSVRRPGSDYDEQYSFPGDDPFFSEVSHFIDTIEGRKLADGIDPQILSSYEDAVKTYELTWAIRSASERFLRMQKEAEDDE